MKVAVIGAGTAGRDFAVACAGAGFSVVLEDVMPDKLRRAKAEFAGLGRGVELAQNVEDAVRDADLAVDFVPDELESKLEIWSLIDRMAPPKTVLCTPSEGLSVSDLASCTYRADRCLMVRGNLTSQGRLRLISAGETSELSRVVAEKVLVGMGFRVGFEEDSDLPMLLKNMRAGGL